MQAGITLSGLEETKVLMASYKDNTSQGKSWIFDSGSTVHVCSQKELFNSLVAKEEGIVKMVDGSACEVIGTGTVKVTERNSACSGGGLVCPGGTIQPNIHKVTQRRRMPNSSATRYRHS